MKPLIHEDFLLHSESAKRLYHGYAKGLPLIDYHNHLPPNEIADNRNFSTITEIWLKGDHYKWRALRAAGTDERFITGNSTDEEKFMHWAAVAPHTLRNPLFHWTQLELANPFGIKEYLNPETAASVYAKTNEQLQQPEFSVQSLLTRFNAEMVGTTDDPCDDLADHIRVAKSGYSVKVLPGFRPDKIFGIENKESFFTYFDR
ncbi:MAG: glucuronate isomerase, partial [Bacteroidota bacterium]